MYDGGLGILEQYGLTAKNVMKGRGALICETQEGMKLIKEYWGSPRKMEFQRKLQQHCREEGFAGVDLILQNQEGQTVTVDTDGTPYVVRDWYMGKECDTRSREDILRSVKALATLHKIMRMPASKEDSPEDLLEECRKHNRELRRIRKFVQGKKKKNAFESCLAFNISRFLELGEKTVQDLEQSGYGELKENDPDTICHGDCNQHNILFTRQGVVFTNFEKWRYDIQTGDLAQFMRKILEKHQWDQELGYGMVKEYIRERELSREELQILKLWLSYPWKFWKLANFYAGSSKVWISQKNTEKLEQTIGQTEPWIRFLQGFPSGN